MPDPVDEHVVELLDAVGQVGAVTLARVHQQQPGAARRGLLMGRSARALGLDPWRAHTAGLFAAARVPILAGGSVWISQGFDPAKTIARMADRALGISHYFSVPQMATTLWQHPDFAPEKLHGLKMYVTGGAPNPKAQVERFARAGMGRDELDAAR